MFFSTTAPTTSFWDCGEFIAASYTLGVPHPPGAPLYLMIGRLFSMIPFAENIGLRVNIFSTLVSAITVMLLYLCIVMLIRIWRGREKTLNDKISIYGSAIVGSLAFAFSHSQWFNAVEAEVYAVSMFFTAVVFFLALRWRDYAGTPAGNRILLFIFYVVGLSTGVHLLNVLALMAVTYIVAFKKYDLTFKSFILIGIMGAVVIFTIYPVIIQGLPTLIKVSKSFSYWSVIIIMIALAWASFEFIRHDKRLPAMVSLSALLVIIGYSTFLIIIIRSGQDPFLDENNPETWSKLLSYLNREQYGSESLFLTMFERKALFWAYQIKKMYIRYLGWQYFEINRFYMLPFLLGMVGAVHHFFREKKGAFVVLTLFFMTGFAILLYLNQDDPQPRERDYAYVGSYFAFAIWIGIGTFALIEMITEWVGRRSSDKRVQPTTVIAVTITALCFALVPMNMLIKNYHTHSRAGNYVAWDYSYNLLNTCEKDAILFTNGDNDTFPLWYLQTVEGVRTDVRVLNLSLFNTGWFIKQIRDKEPKVPMPAKITDEYIENYIDSRDVTGLMDRYWQERRKVKIDGPTPDDPTMVWEIPATLSYPVGPQGKMEHFLRVQDIMILYTMFACKWEKPIYFAVTVSDQNLIGLRNIADTSKNYLKMEGLAFKLMPHPTELIDPDLMAENLLKKYKYRNINNPKIHYGDNIIKLLGNYRQGLLQLAYHYIGEAQTTGMMGEKPVERTMTLAERIDKFDELDPRTKALTALDFMSEIIPEDLIPIRHDVIRVQIGRLYSQLGHPEEISKRLDAITNEKNLNAQNAFEYGVYYLSEAQSEEKAKEMFNYSLRRNFTIENIQRVVYTWIQFTSDTTYAADLLRNYLVKDNSHQSRLLIATQAQMFGLDGLAFSIYEPLLQANPNDNEAVKGMIEYYKRTKQYKQGLELIDSWLSTHPDDRLMTNKRDELSNIIALSKQ
ncbi:MAG: DUF2723 domain-containing protein [Candidatus Hatepunaea meridiana]|nr:DUF2723 domain-containing protein [Candidatus Hatepunaea meridiana]